MSYYQVKELYPWLYQVSDPRGVHCYLLAGTEKALLYDTAFGVGDMPAAIRAITNKPLTVVLGHGHWDHSGGAYQFPEVYVHENDFDLCRLHASSDYREMLFGWGGPLPEGFDKEAHVKHGTGNMKALAVGTVIDLGGLSAEVIHMEGHSTGSIGLFVKERTIVLISDALGGWLFLNESTTLKEYAAMLKRLDKLDFDFMYGGHTAEAISKSHVGLTIKAAENATMDKAKPYPQEFRGLKGFEYREGNIGVIFNERTIQGQ